MAADRDSGTRRATGADGPAPAPRSTGEETSATGTPPVDDVPGRVSAAGTPSGSTSGRFGQPGRPLRRNPFLVGLGGAAGVLLAYTVFLAIRNAASMLVLVFVALFLAIGLNPAVVRLRRWGLPHGLAVAVVALTMVLLLCGGVVALVPPLVAQTQQFVDHLPGYLETIRRNETVSELIVRYNLVQRVEEAANADNITRAVGGLFGGARFVFGTLFNVLTVLVLTIYFMSAFERMRALAYGLVPASRRDRVQLIGDEILTKVGQYLVGALAIALLAGVSAFGFSMVVGLPYPFALAVVVAVCDLIPQIGATLAAIIVSLVGFADSISVGITCLIFFILYQQVENYLIYPRVMRRSVQVSDVAAIVAALVGVALFGVIGALVAIPAVAAAQLIIREVVLPRQQSR
jgi:predicted PurR-regulated permease PerM